MFFILILLTICGFGIGCYFGQHAAGAQIVGLRLGVYLIAFVFSFIAGAGIAGIVCLALGNTVWLTSLIATAVLATFPGIVLGRVLGQR
ncbi:MAG: hypothetical protein K2W82_11315 [Candidatus Obscuribacterales bacterium]|nr:hypothetical protein [Candidatus Obscuribacterales bacterium]